MKKMKKLLRKDLSVITGNGMIDTCHMNGDSASCWTDCECSFGKACQLDDDGNPGRCVGSGGGGTGGGTGGGGCLPPNDCTEQPY